MRNDSPPVNHTVRLQHKTSPQARFVLNKDDFILPLSGSLHYDVVDTRSHSVSGEKKHSH